MSDDSWHPRHRYIETRGTAPVGREESLPIAETPEDFAKQVIRLMSDPALVNQIRRKARKLVEEDFNWERSSDLVAGVYQKALEFE